MASRSIAAGTITFGLVSIPVKMYVATSSKQITFHMIHASCGTRVKQQLYCPHHKRVVPRSEIVKGYEPRKGRIVALAKEDLDAVEAEANRAIDIREFVPLAAVDPVYFEDTHYLGPDRDAEKAYHLLARAMREKDRSAVAQYVHHGKEHLVLIRPYEHGLALHTLYYADEVRDLAGIDVGRAPKLSAGEIATAEKLIEQLSADGFRPEQYDDAYRERLKAALGRKGKGVAATTVEEEEPRGKVVDLMEALKASLGQGRARSGGRRRGTTRRRAPAARAAGASR
jgi:DNA end-binding protein Ku